MSHKAVRAALETALNTWATDNILPIAWQNRPYTPTVGTKYARAYLLPAETQNPSLGDTHKRLIGILQVSLYLPQGNGAGDAETLADSLCTAFARGQSYIASGVTVRVLDSPSVHPALDDTGWFVVPVDVRYQADIY